MQIMYPDGYKPTEAQETEIVKTLIHRPLPDGYIYTLVSFVSVPQVRVQAMRAHEANDILDTGWRRAATADTLEEAIAELAAILEDETG